MKAILFFILIIIIGACTRVSHDHEETACSHEAVRLQSTLFTDSNEFFYEYSPLIKGEEAEFLIHITYLPSYKPYTAGSLTVSLGGAEVREDAPESPGIFRVSLTPTHDGTLPMLITLISGDIKEVVTDTVFVYASHDAAHDVVEAPQEPGLVSYLKEQSWKQSFRVSKADYLPFSSIIHTSGELQSLPGEKQFLSAKSSGLVVFSIPDLVQGSPVHKGQVLFTITGADVAEQNIGVQFAALQTRYLASKEEYERHKKLFDEQVISARQCTETRSRFLIDSTAYASLARTTSAGGIRIVSPMDGYLHEMNVSQGQFVETGRLLATVSSNQLLLLRADVPQQFYRSFHEIETAHFRPAYSDRTYTVEELHGQLLARAASVAENDHYMPVFFRVRNDGTLLEGAFAECYLMGMAREDRLVIPASSLMEEQGSIYVYVQRSGESYLKRKITLGEGDGFNVSVTSGLNAGEYVVSQGSMLIKSASLTTGMGAHNHEH